MNNVLSICRSEPGMSRRRIAYQMSLVDNAPDGDDWLGPRERERQATLHVAKRRREWRLGRWIAKRALCSWRRNVPLSRLEIVAAEDGAPEAFEGPARLPLSISITHRANVAVCAVALGDSALGCDLELVEHRSDRFIADFFTADEARLVWQAPPAARDWLACLIWSAKESTLKALRTGLRRDTRSVEVFVPEANERLLAADPRDLDGRREFWQPLVVFDRDSSQRFDGWWCRNDDLLLSTVCSPAAEVPIRLDREQLLDQVLEAAADEPATLSLAARG